MANGMLVGDGSWNLKVFVTDLQTERCLRVRGDVHIGGVMLRLAEELNVPMNWSDHALWWPAKNMWLTRTRSTLDQYGVQADAFLHFTPMHKTLRVQLPDLRYLDCRVDFSIKTFNAVINLCKELGIRHPEELSLCKPLEPCHLKSNYKEMQAKKHHRYEMNGNNIPPDTNTFIANHSPTGSTHSLDKTFPPFLCAPVSSSKSQNSTPISSPIRSNTWKNDSYKMNGNHTTNGHNISLELLNGSTDTALAHSPAVPTHEARSKLVKPKSLVERARMNVAWLDSSLSIMEQGVKEFDTLRLRFKFYSFYDLNARLDAVRINQLYEQAKWQILNEEIDCTEEEALMFAALQVQVTLQAGVPQLIEDSTNLSAADDDIDAALTDLEFSLEGSHIHSPVDITQVPELSDYLRFLKPKRFTLKAYKRFWFTCKDLQLHLYKNHQDSKTNSPVYEINLRGCEVTPDVNLSQSKFGIKLEVPSADGMSEMWIRCDTEEQYAKWMAACRLASKGRSLADSSFEAETRSIAAFLQMQRAAPAPAINPASLDITPEDYVPSRFTKKLKGKLVQRILEAHANVKSLSSVDAKMNYIKAWQSLPDFGVSLFVVKLVGHKKEELLGVASNRLMRMDINTGDHIKIWRFNTVKAWNVNWEVKQMMVQFEDSSIVFSVLSADCKVIHEFIGGYIFLSMRSKDSNQSLNEELYHKLTSGWV
ncbi:unnamed protein product [Bemisia tabaci]|uniref:Unc-112-related protein n=1 Tax=Bemisia tabaci TaxID=7038 RepID=A0A9P0A4T1_BEMTA|nr:unnamed protein product [Bemisia tabaci]